MRPREPRRRVGLHILQRIAHSPPGPWGTAGGDQPRPPAPGRLLLHTIFYLFLSTSYLLTPAFLLTRTPPPSSLGVGGIRFPDMWYEKESMHIPGIFYRYTLRVCCSCTNQKVCISEESVAMLLEGLLTTCRVCSRFLPTLETSH